MVRTVKLRPDLAAQAHAAAAQALGMSEPGPAITPIDTDVNGRPPRIPAIGLHPGAIDGSVPHRNRKLDRWERRR